MLSFKGKSNKVLSRAMTEQMLEAQIGGHGLGPAVNGKSDDFRFSHGGSNEGFRCFFVAYPETGKGIAIMTNSDNGSKLIAEILRGFAQVYDVPDFKPRQKALVQLDAGHYRKLVGEFALGSMPQFSITVGIENEHLFVCTPADNDTSVLYPESEITYFELANDYKFTFLPHADGKVDSISIAGVRQEALIAVRKK